MSRFELSLSQNYIQSWTVVEAIRELFQNALDQQIVQPDNEMFFDYSSTSNTLTVGNKLSALDIRSLLLGESTKREDKRTIGQFGEGYKLALLVLCRLGKEVTIYNYAKRETWHPKIVQSRRYGTGILVVDVDTKFIWSRVPDNNLTFEIQGITSDEYLEITKANLHLHPPEDIISLAEGDVLLEECFRGEVFVNGLYVSKTDLHFGYNFHPKYIELDRDRRLIPDFNLSWTLGCLWRNYDNPEFVASHLMHGYPDFKYYHSEYLSKNSCDATSQAAYEKFQSVYGKDAIPVTTQDDIDEMTRKLPEKTKLVVVPQICKTSLMNAVPLRQKVAELEEERSQTAEVLSPLEELELFIASIRVRLVTPEREKIDGILERLKEWCED